MSSIPGRVWLATSGQDYFDLKYVPQAIHSSFNEDILPRLGKSLFLRLPCDNIPGQQIYVYKYMDDDLLSLVRKGASVSHDIVHLDIKPDNIMLDCSGAGSKITIEDVRIIDLENAAYLPKGRCIKGVLAGNESWHPEGHFKGELNKPSEIFSFATVCIYAMLGQDIFGVDEDLRNFEAQGVLPHIIRLQRQVSFFGGDRKGVNGLMAYVGDEEVNCQVLGLLWDDRAADYHSYRSFSTWPNVSDDVFKDFIAGMTNLEPRKRTTAREALSHPWFGDDPKVGDD